MYHHHCSHFSLYTHVSTYSFFSIFFLSYEPIKLQCMLLILKRGINYDPCSARRRTVGVVYQSPTGVVRPRRAMATIKEFSWRERRTKIRRRCHLMSSSTRHWSRSSFAGKSGGDQPAAKSRGETNISQLIPSILVASKILLKDNIRFEGLTLLEFKRKTNMDNTIIRVYIRDQFRLED